MFDSVNSELFNSSRILVSVNQLLADECNFEAYSLHFAQQYA
jgi:hypothetical protein